jgi:hypothetical protein
MRARRDGIAPGALFLFVHLLWESESGALAREPAEWRERTGAGQWRAFIRS